MANTAHFEVEKRKDGTYGFRLRAANGEIIAVSEGYVDEAGAHRGVKAVRHAVGDILNHMTPTEVIET
jgi:uncharacterized protein YegP (UPF0339 family)